MANSINKVVIQKLLKKVEDDYYMAEKYYSIISTINDLKLTQREIQLISFIAVKGNISYSNVKDEFCKRFDSSSATIYNMISKLKKINVLVKDNSKLKVNPIILIDFKKNIKLEIDLQHITDNIEKDEN
jgi:Fe2+ or Zn2+ uptake regulation protein